ncbi:MAG: hypothetical protein K9G11_00730 [Rickettsiaceae bacterium]|nr:hypothetical protein [Rickettsiaceae bacterium]
MVYPELTIIVVGALCQGKERNDPCALPLGDVATLLKWLQSLENNDSVGKKKYYSNRF